jgi:hypothetical protein
VHPAAIYAEDFDGMAELAAHVARVASDRAEHARYFEWVGRTAEAWPTHYGEIEARRQGARSFMQYACERTLDGRRPGGGAHRPTHKIDYLKVEGDPSLHASQPASQPAARAHTLSHAHAVERE